MPSRCRFATLLACAVLLASPVNAQVQPRVAKPSATILQSPTMPNLRGLTPDAANKLLAPHHRQVDSVKRVPSKSPAGTIVWQSPDSGSAIKAGQPITVGVAVPLRLPAPQGIVTAHVPNLAANPASGDSLHRVPVSQIPTMPNLVGLTPDSARTLLAPYQVTIGRVDSAPTNAPPGTIVWQWPDAGRAIKPGLSSAVRVATAVDDVAARVPTLVGRTSREVAESLKSAGLVPGPIDSVLDPAHLGRVARQSPSPGAIVKRRTPVAVWYGKADTRVPVPRLVGMSPEEARAALGRAGLSRGQVDSLPGEGRTVSRQVPDENALVAPGSRVDISYWYHAPVKVAVPNLSGSTVDAASRALAVVGLRIGPISTVPTDGDTGRVITQRPSPQTRVDSGSRVSITIGRVRQVTPPTTTVPSVVGEALQDANAALAHAGLVSGPVERVPSARTAGTVLTQDPQGGTSAIPGSAVALGIAAPLPDTLVPDVLGRPLNDAIRVIMEAGLRVDHVDSIQREQGDGRVARQRPAAGTRVARGAAESLTVAIAPPPTRMPRVIDSTEVVATAMIRAVGLTAITVRGRESPGTPGRVLAQAPAPGTLVHPNTPVTLNVAVAIARVLVPSLTGSDEAGARKVLATTGLILGTVSGTAGSVEHAKIVAQVPAAGTSVRRGTRVDVTVGPADTVVAPPLSVPYLVGMRADSAESLLARATLRTTPIDSPVGFAPGGSVLRQDPPGGANAVSGATVRVWVGRSRDIPWVLIAGGLTALGALAALAKAMGTRPRPLQPGTAPVLWLEPHAVSGKHAIGTGEGPVVRHELQLTPHAGAATQRVEGDETFTRELP